MTYSPENTDFWQNNALGLTYEDTDFSDIHKGDLIKIDQPVGGFKRPTVWEVTYNDDVFGCIKTRLYPYGPAEMEFWGAVCDYTLPVYIGDEDD